MGWPRPERLVPLRPPRDPDAYRLGELVVIVRPPARRSRDELVAWVTRAGYEALEGTPDWQHFRPRSAWWNGIGRHARLRTSELHLRVDGEPGGGQRIRAVGLLTGSVEHLLATVGALYAPVPGVSLRVVR
jgi:hypothetical protein